MENLIVGFIIGVIITLFIYVCMMIGGGKND